MKKLLIAIAIATSACAHAGGGVGMVLKYLLEHPELVEQMTGPGQVDSQQFQASFWDMGQQVLHCYHPTARFRDVAYLGTDSTTAAKMRAAGSAVIRIDFDGQMVSGYQMIVGIYNSGRYVRARVLDENSSIPYNNGCSLEGWQRLLP